VTLEELREAVEVVQGDDADSLRKRFVARFVDTESNAWRGILARTREYEDGIAYQGYLWDALARWERMSEDEVITELERAGGTWLALWDVNTAENIFIPDYWKFGKSAILRGAPATLAAGRELLPEDVYFVPEDFAYTLVLTHGHDATGRVRDCLRALPRNPIG
jgi:hypothetical protein